MKRVHVRTALHAQIVDALVRTVPIVGREPAHRRDLLDDRVIDLGPGFARLARDAILERLRETQQTEPAVQSLQARLVETGAVVVDVDADRLVDMAPAFQQPQMDAAAAADVQHPAARCAFATVAEEFEHLVGRHDARCVAHQRLEPRLLLAELVLDLSVVDGARTAPRR